MDADIATVDRFETIESDFFIIEAKDTKYVSMVGHEFTERLDRRSAGNHRILVVDIDAVLRSRKASDASAHGGGLLFLLFGALLVELNAAHLFLGGVLDDTLAEVVSSALVIGTPLLGPM